MGKIILICGKICSGKSFYARSIRERENAVILSTDEVTWDLTDNKQGEDYDHFARRVNAYLRKKAAELANIGCTVILDWGFWSKHDREEIAAYFGERNIPIQWHYIDVDEKMWRQNIARRNQKVLNGEGGPDFYVDEGLLSKVLSKFEAPEKCEINVWHRPVLQ